VRSPLFRTIVIEPDRSVKEKKRFAAALGVVARAREPRRNERGYFFGTGVSW
jgi:hypothetical protein